MISDVRWSVGWLIKDKLFGFEKYSYSKKKSKKVKMSFWMGSGENIWKKSYVQSEVGIVRE